MAATAGQPHDGNAPPLREALRGWLDSDAGRVAAVAFDLATVVAFLALTFVPPSPWVTVADAVLGALMAVELAVRWVAARDRRAFALQPWTLVDAGIIVTLLLPSLVGSFAFLRILRAVRVVRALRVVVQLRRRSRWVCEHGELIQSATNLVVFTFVTSSLVYELQAGRNDKINTFTDALYFTVTTLTTTGFGDITLTGESGRLASVVIMIVGISLFVKLAQSIVRPRKVHFECPQCGLYRHDPDAVHCKHCGVVLHIPDEGL